MWTVGQCQKRYFPPVSQQNLLVRKSGFHWLLLAHVLEFLHPLKVIIKWMLFLSGHFVFQETTIWYYDAFDEGIKWLVRVAFF